MSELLKQKNGAPTTQEVLTHHLNSRRMGRHSVAADLGTGEADRRTNLQARRRRRSPPPSDRGPSLWQSGVGALT
jgi:hypothetical protein